LISPSTLYPSPANAGISLNCLVQPVTVLSTTFGIAYDSVCTFSGSTYTVNIPIGGLTAGEYLITIFGKNPATSVFNLPPTPMRL